MKRLLLIVLATTALTAHAQTTERPHWYGYPQDRQASALIGGLTGAIFYSTARAVAPDQPKVNAMAISAGTTLVTSLAMYAMNGTTPVERRQNFTASLLSGLTITLVFSLGI